MKNLIVPIEREGMAHLVGDCLWLILSEQDIDVIRKAYEYDIQALNGVVYATARGLSKVETWVIYFSPVIMKATLPDGGTIENSLVQDGYCFLPSEVQFLPPGSKKVQAELRIEVPLKQFRFSFRFMFLSKPGPILYTNPLPIDIFE